MSCNCAARFCSNAYHRNKKENLSFFAFPTEKNLYCEWANLCLRPDITEQLLPVSKKNQKYRLCEKHFRPCDIYPSGTRKFLRDGSIPLGVRIEIPRDLGIKKPYSRPQLPQKQSDSEIYLRKVVTPQGIRLEIPSDLDGERPESRPDFSPKLQTNSIQPIITEDYINVSNFCHITGSDNPDVNINKSNLSPPSLPFKDDQMIIMLQMSDQSSSNNSQSNEISNTCSSKSSICSHHISFIEERAKSHKLEKLINILQDETHLQREEISRLKARIKILEDIPNITFGEENIKYETERKYNFNNFDDSSDPLKVEFIVKEEEELQ